MDDKEKLSILAEILDAEEDEISKDTAFADLDYWDSVAVLSFIAMMDDEFGKTVKGADIKKFVTLGDAMAIMEA